MVLIDLNSELRRIYNFLKAIDYEIVVTMCWCIVHSKRKNKMKFVLISFFSVFFLTNKCSDYPPQEFERQGISFTTPNGWKLTDLMEYGPMGGQVTAEKAGLNESAIVVISWFNFDMDTDPTLLGLQEGLSTGVLRLRKASFSEISDYQMGEFSARRITYEGNLLGQKILGELIGFIYNERTITVFRQESAEDISKNKLEFEELLGSIVVGSFPTEK